MTYDDNYSQSQRSVACTCNDKLSAHETTRVRTPPDAEGFSRCIAIAGAHHCERMVPGVPDRDPNSHGVGPVRMLFVLIGPKGATSWLLNTGWYLEVSRKHLAATEVRSTGATVDAWELAYHARAPQYQGEEPTESCQILLGEPCYHDRSSVEAKTHTEGFLRSPGIIWAVLRAKHDALK